MLTLITATLNAEAFLERALVSAAVQAGPIQHIVVDGGSRDGTVAICRRFPEVELAVVPGCSIYEAWNIGLDRARGEAVMFLNADDELCSQTAARVTAALTEYPDAAIVAGRAEFVAADRPNQAAVTVASATGDRLALSQLAAGVPAINALAFRRAVFERYGRFEIAYRVAGDRAFLLRLALAPMPPRVVPLGDVLYRYTVHSGSLTLSRGLTQRLRIAREHIALSRALLAGDVPPAAAMWLKHMRRRDAAVATLRCLASGRGVEAIRFAGAIFG